MIDIIVYIIIGIVIGYIVEDVLIPYFKKSENQINSCPKDDKSEMENFITYYKNKIGIDRFKKIEPVLKDINIPTTKKEIKKIIKDIKEGRYDDSFDI